MSSKPIYTITTPTPQRIKNKYNSHKGFSYVPYVYLIKCIPTGMVYYGSRFAKCAHPEFLFKDYFTSSKIMHNLILAYGIHNFEFQIRRTFNTSDECMLWEGKVLRRLKVSTHEKFINLDENQKIHDNSNTTFITNEETGKCIRVKSGMPLPIGWIFGVKKSNRPMGRKWFHDPITNEPHHVLPEDAEPHWVPGRGSGYKSNSETLKQKELVSITDGTDNKFINKKEPTPIGWWYGRTKTEQERKKNADANTKTLGCIYINDGTITKRLGRDNPIPHGWVKGHLTLQKMKAASREYNTPTL